MNSVKRTKCLHCNRVVECKQHTNRKFCSLKCQQQLKANTAAARSAELLKAGKLTDVCRPRIKRAMDFLGVENQCSLCGITEWLGKPIPFILDHINGDSSNNTLENLRLLCSNCDSQTAHYKGKNKGRGRQTLKLIK